MRWRRRELDGEWPTKFKKYYVRMGKHGVVLRVETLDGSGTKAAMAGAMVAHSWLTTLRFLQSSGVGL